MSSLEASNRTNNMLFQQIGKSIRKAKGFSNKNNGVIASKVLTTDKFSSVVMSVCQAGDTDCACS
jgi:hypothetical protein